MKKTLMIIGIVILSIIGFAGYKYMPLIAPAISAQGKTTTEIADEQNQLNRELASTLQNEGGVDTDIIHSLTAPIEEQAAESPSPSPVRSPKTVHMPSNREAIINTHLKQIEQFKTAYAREIVDLMQRAKTEYRNLPPEQKNPNAITAIGFKYADMALAMEAGADQRYQNILNTLENELKAEGSSTGVVDEMRSYYSNFKEVQKQNYIAEIIAASDR